MGATRLEASLIANRQAGIGTSFLGFVSCLGGTCTAVRPQTEHAASLGDGPHSLVRLDVLVFSMPLGVERTLSKASQKPYVRILLP